MGILTDILSSLGLDHLAAVPTAGTAPRAAAAAPAAPHAAAHATTFGATAGANEILQSMGQNARQAAFSAKAAADAEQVALRQNQIALTAVENARAQLQYIMNSFNGVTDRVNGDD